MNMRPGIRWITSRVSSFDLSMVLISMITVYRPDDGLDFDAMDVFITVFVLKAIKEHGSRAVRVFPLAS